EVAARFRGGIPVTLGVQEGRNLLSFDLLFIQRPQHDRGCACILKLPDYVDIITQRPGPYHQRVRQPNPKVLRVEFHLSSEENPRWGGVPAVGLLSTTHTTL